MRSTLILASMALLTAGCRDSGGPNNGGPGTRTDGGTTMMNFECPGEGQTICAMKRASSSRHPAVGDPIQLDGVVVTTATVVVDRDDNDVPTLAAFYVQDPAGADFLEGRYSGIAVVYNPSELQGAVPVIGTKVNITGTYAEHGYMEFEKQKQIRASRVDSTGELATITPITVSAPNLIARNGADSAAYEGVLVRVESVTVNEARVMVNGMPLFGAFRLEGDLIVSGQFFEYRGAMVGEIFSQITGVLRVGTAPFDAGEYLLSPRAAGEVVSQNPRVVIGSIDAINNPSAPGFIRDICTQAPNPGGFTCPKVELRRVLVVAVDGFVNDTLRALWVVDPNDADGLYSGIKVVYNPMRVSNIPERGQFVDIDGELLSFFMTRQVQFPTFTRNGTDTMEATPRIIVPDRIGMTAPTGIEHLGSLVTIENVSVIDRCLEGNNGDDFGGWLVTGNVQIGTAFRYDYHGGSRPMGTVCQTPMRESTGACLCEGNMIVPRVGDMRRDGDMFRSITGIVDYGFNVYQLVPRGNDDLVRQ